MPTFIFLLMLSFPGDHGRGWVLFARPTLAECETLIGTGAPYLHCEKVELG